ncbi:MAG: DUF6122 family protein [Pseudomonadota bacterium]
MIHIALHFIVPGLFVLVLYRARWKMAYAVLMLTMLVDLDHLLATPIYDPNRCSIGFHPLHHIEWIAMYCALLLIPKLRWIGVGLCIHMALDSIDCQLTNGVWITA